MTRRASVGLVGLLVALGLWLAPARVLADMCFGGGSREIDDPDSGAAGTAGADGAVSLRRPAQGGVAFGLVAAASIGLCWVLLRRPDRNE
jgi:hypothetical protein